MYKRSPQEPIAIIGSSCRFAGAATSPSKLWQVLANPPDLSKEVPTARFNAQAFYHEDGEHLGTTNSIRAYWLEQDHRVFDASFFNITPKEAEAIDPQQRLLLEVVYEAMESSGLPMHRYSGSNVGVFAGVMTADYDTLSQRDELSASQYYATGNARSIISNRVSYFFNFRGPSMTIDTACSSSLVALHQAVLSIRAGEIPMACVTGVNLMITPEQFLVESSLHMLSPTGKSRMWDQSADGYARGEGIAAIFIKPLSLALHDGDEIMGLIRQTGVNSDGRTPGITMPNPSAQADLIRNTYLSSGLDPRSPEDRCQYFEAHGTGTQAGDPREAQAIHNAFFGAGLHAETEKTMLVGSVKTVIGHTEGAAGLAGVLKVLQAMEHGKVPPNLHLNQVNPTILPFYNQLEVPTSLVAWPQTLEGHPRRASVNSFGFGGTNSHAIIESYDPQLHGAAETSHSTAILQENDFLGINPEKDTNPDILSIPLLISASSRKSLFDVARHWRSYLAACEGISIPQLSSNMFRYRTALPYRAFIPATSKEKAIENLDKAINEEQGVHEFGVRSKTLTQAPQILGIFTGQGAQWSSMSRTLLQTNQRYRQTIQNLDQTLQQSQNPPSWTLEHQILADEPQSRTHEAQISQPLCTALQIGLIDVLEDLGVVFRAVVGHSSGEIAAAYAAKMLSARDAILISYYRGLYAHLARGTNGERGAMMAAGISENEALSFCQDPLFDGKICVAASNAPSSVTLSGDVHMIQTAKDMLTEQSRFARVLQVDTAYHSPHMTKPAQVYMDALETCGIMPCAGKSNTTWISSVHGYDKRREKDLMSTYWRDNMVEAVQFYDAVRTAISDLGPFDCAVEVGPHPALKGPVTQTVKAIADTPLPYYGLLERSKDDGLAFAEFLGSMWCQFGPMSVDIAQYVRQSSTSPAVDIRLNELPSYQWDHTQTHYRESRVSRQYHFKNAAPHELLGVRTRDDNAFELRWRNVLRPDKLPWLQGHCFQGQALIPASAYCIMALDSALQLLNGRSASVVELRDIDIVSGISMESDSAGTELLFSLKVNDQHKDKNVIAASFTLTSCPADGSTAMRKNASGNVIISLEDTTIDALPRRQVSLSETLPANTDAFYKMMDDTGLVYSGPFRSLQTIQRRYDFASTTLSRRHPEDTTELVLSPATLDSCLQSAFLTYSSPGDKSLWTSFLPTRIARIQFNIASLYNKSKTEDLSILIVDSHLTEVHGSKPDSRATFTVEIGIFNENDEMEVEIEGLTVAAFANTRPDEDYELYLHTVMDADPTDEIVLPGGNTEEFAPELEEICNKITSLYTMGKSSILHGPQTTKKVLSYRREDESARLGDHSTLESIQAQASLSPCNGSMEFLQDIGRSVSALLPSVIPQVIYEAGSQLRYSHHLERIVKQISHRYPRMAVLNIVGAGVDLSQTLLRGLGSSYLSFATVFSGQGSQQALELPKLRTPVPEHEPHQWLDVNDDILKQLESTTLLDLVIIDTTILAHGDPQIILRNVRASMPDHGFLLLVQFDESPLRRRLRFAVEPSKVAQPRFHVQEEQSLLEECGFLSIAKNSDQQMGEGFSINIRQTSSTIVPPGKVQQPLVASPLTEKVLIIGHGDIVSVPICYELQRILARDYVSIDLVGSIESLDTSQLQDYTSAIVLEDLECTVMSNMTEKKLSHLKELLHPNMTVLWITHNARFGNPEHASTLGFTRTVSAEVPNLKLQVLDLDETIDCEDLIARVFMELVAPVSETSQSLWTREPEIYMSHGRRLVARVLPLKESNNRVNANRRIVSRPVNTINEVVRVTSRYTEDGGAGLVVKKLGLAPRGSLGDKRIILRNCYSTVEAVKSENDSFYHLCIGTDLTTGTLKMAMTTTNASYIEVPVDQTQVLPKMTLAMPQFLHCLARYQVSMTILKSQLRANHGSIIFIDADPLLIRCAKVVAESEAAPFISWSTSASRHSDSPVSIRIHERSSDRKLKAMLPPSGATVYDFSSGSDFSERMVNLLPDNCDYYFGSSFLTSHWVSERDDGDADVSVDLFNHAATLTLGDTENFHDGLNNTLSINEAITKNSHEFTVNIIDWTAERNTHETVEPLLEQQLLSAHKTYVLVGLTRDLGQSLSRLFVEHGARNIVLASRNPAMSPAWTDELRQAHGAHVVIEKLDVTSLEDIARFRGRLKESMPEVGGLINGAMVLDDRVFSQMTVETWNRVLRPKTVGSQNLDTVFSDLDLEFFIMTSSFAAIGGHPGQCNYAAANMYMNGLAASRRQRGLAGSVLNIGVIYGLGLLQREKEELYIGLEREGYPPISERDIHHMFLEAIVAGRPNTSEPFDITTGLKRFIWGSPSPLHWHQDPRFSHFTLDDGASSTNAETSAQGSLREQLSSMDDIDSMADCLIDAFTGHLKVMLQLPDGSISRHSSLAEIGIDSLVAVDIRNWIWKTLTRDVAVLKILGASSIDRFCLDIAEQILAEYYSAQDSSEAETPSTARTSDEISRPSSTGVSTATTEHALLITGKDAMLNRID